MSTNHLFILLLLFINYIIIITHSHKHKHHKCIHDEIDHIISHQFVKYRNHPLSNKNKETLDTNTNKARRKLIESNQWKPIRIRPYYDPQTILSNHQLDISKIAYIKKLISASINYLQKFVSVIPIDGPLLINRCQRNWLYDEFLYSVCPLSDYQTPLKCQYATIPEQHIAESWYYNPLSLKSTLYKFGGSGIVDTDLVIYVTYSSNGCGNNDGSTLAWASTCNLDQYGRPIAGTINFCPGALTTQYWKFDVGVTLHELMHTVIMSNNLFQFFYDRDRDKFKSKKDVISESTTNGLDNSYIITPKVKQIAQNHFGCYDDGILIGAPLENEGGSSSSSLSHWEGKYLQSELMCSTIFTAIMYLSDFTLSLMEDSGWYKIDYNYSQSITWGLNQGCSFINSDCINKLTSKSNYDQYWCTNNLDDGCSSDYSAISNCIDPTFGSSSSHDYCSFRQPVILPQYLDFESICRDIRGNIYTNSPEFPSSLFGLNSRCVTIYDDQSGTTQLNGYCFKHECYGYNIFTKSYSGVRITISDGLIDNQEIISCSTSDTLKISSVYGKYIKCPDINSICGSSTRPFQCNWGQWNDQLNQCICSVGYIGIDCSIKDDYTFAIEAYISTLSSNNISPQYGTGICVENSSISSINGYYAYNGDYEGIPSYNEYYTGAKYIYFLRYYSQWNIGNVKGDVSIFAYCKDVVPSTQIMDIQQCKHWAIWSNANEIWSWDPNMNVHHCTPTTAPTDQPTFEPTFQPTIEPTFEPTTEPTQEPTGHPTRNPSKKPTKSPSIDPTISPTSYPTKRPSLDPTTIPTSSPSIDPTKTPTLNPTRSPTFYPTFKPTSIPSWNPTHNLTGNPTRNPSSNPSDFLTIQPTLSPTKNPTRDLTIFPSSTPTVSPTHYPSFIPSYILTFVPSMIPSMTPSRIPSIIPSTKPSVQPSISPSYTPSIMPTDNPSFDPSEIPTKEPIYVPTIDKITSITPSFAPSIDETAVSQPTQATSRNTPTNTEKPTRPNLFGPGFNRSFTFPNSSFYPTKKPFQETTLVPLSKPSQAPFFDDDYFHPFPPTQAPTKRPSRSPTLKPTQPPTTRIITDSPTRRRVTKNIAHQNWTLMPTVSIRYDPVVDNDNIKIEHSGKVSQSGGWLIGIFSFVGICIFMNIGFIFLWNYHIKPKWSHSNGSQAVRSVSVIQMEGGIMFSENNDPSSSIDDKDMTHDHLTRTENINTENERLTIPQDTITMRLQRSESTEIIMSCDGEDSF